MRHLVYSGQAGDHPVLVTDEDGLRTLRFGTEERQTCIDLRAPWELQLAYTQWMVIGLLFHPQPERFLLIGLGGGALPHFLLHHHPGAQVDVVEKEKRVIELAHAYFRLPRQAGLRLVNRDALSFLHTDSATGYHFALLDIFGPGAMAPALFDPVLYRLLLARLSPEGVLAVNLWSGDQTLYAQALQAADEGCGGRVLRMEVKKRSNVILLCFPGEIPYQTIKKAHKHSTEAQQRYGIDFTPALKRLRRGNRSSWLHSLFALN